uniref:Uncharacterized protein n=1 Tax=Anguilla anguilla TaxID=7936 RepID=A0A0E9W440_ANGAN
MPSSRPVFLKSHFILRTRSRQSIVKPN